MKSPTGKLNTAISAFRPGPRPLRLKMGRLDPHGTEFCTAGAENFAREIAQRVRGRSSAVWRRFSMTDLEVAGERDARPAQKPRTPLSIDIRMLFQLYGGELEPPGLYPGRPERSSEQWKRRVRRSPVGAAKRHGAAGGELEAYRPPIGKVSGRAADTAFEWTKALRPGVGKDSSVIQTPFRDPERRNSNLAARAPFLILNSGENSFEGRTHAFTGSVYRRGLGGAALADAQSGMVFPFHQTASYRQSEKNPPLPAKGLPYTPGA